MTSLKNAIVNDILLPDTAGNFSNFLEGSSGLEPFGLRPRAIECIYVKAVLDAVLQAAHVLTQGAAKAIRNPAEKAAATTNPLRLAAATAHSVARAKPVSVKDLVAPADKLGVGNIVPRAMTVWKEVDAVLQARNVVAMANAITHEQRLVVKRTTPSGHVPGATNAVQVVTAPTLHIGSVMRTVRVTTDIEPDTGDAPEFTCAPMSATNDEGETLELDEGCTLHYSASAPTTTSDAAARLRRDAEAAPKTGEALALLARQASCKATSTFTRTVWETETETETGTRTITVQGERGTFSCPPMEVTNDVGDVLALDEECALSFSLGEPTSTEGGEATARAGGPAETGESSTASASAGGDSGNDAGSVCAVRVSTTMGVAGAVLLWLML
ncbi:hypothetical protein FSARC_3216 [Fusarium sarcochroum]|uniref:Ig-like domain-containing protein n=1 Tax=Fusarium sarcochroum TaxID=1208366 RepID=A0A8H4U483_9HYPO|nr:hypothetical protein FSARC_3216 [Fusarium sarcochroum]